MSETPNGATDSDDPDDFHLIKPTAANIEGFLSEMEKGGYEIELAVYNPHKGKRGSSTLSVELRRDGVDD